MKITTFYLTMATFLATATTMAQTTDNKGVILLDLSKATTTLQFDNLNGMWNGTYHDDETEIESQVFSIVHGSMSDYDTWWGFTASNATDNKFQANTLTYQFSNMALGGITLDDEGNIKKNNFGAPVPSKDMPYLVGFPMAGFPPAQIAFNNGKSYEVLGAYVNLNTYTFYSLIYGASPARPFTQGDNLILKVTGEKPDGDSKSVEITLASYDNGNLTASTGWTYVDLSELGLVDELKFSMSGTDSGAWGLNTPSYFCLDKLAVREVVSSAIEITDAFESKQTLSYDRVSKSINVSNRNFTAVYDSFGHMVMSVSDVDRFSVENLPSGIYVVKSGNNRLKFVR